MYTIHMSCVIYNIYVIIYVTIVTNETISLDTRYVVTRLLVTITFVLLEI